tara:strand:- start:81 stop:566 length:486 start_codon:yes stop_codon:yes gene_type:complete
MYVDNILNKSLQLLNLKLYKSNPSGNCFFSSIAKYFKLSNDYKGNAKIIRKNIINYIKNNNDITCYIQNTLGMSLIEINDDLDELRKTGIYDLDIFDILPIIIATQYNIKITIYTWMDLSNTLLNDNDKEIYFPINCENREINEIILLYSNLEHYDLLYPN